MSCELCLTSPARLLKPSTKQKTCITCFITSFEDGIHQTIIKTKMFEKNDRIAICVSGGKDSTVLAHVIHLLNIRYSYGINLELLSIDEGIKGYRDDSLKIVKQNQKDYNLPLHILSYKDLYGMTMDEVMINKNNSKKNSCSFCGVFRRKALEIGAKQLNCNKMLLGHNADDLAETVILNFMRGDFEKLKICAADVPVSTNDSVLRLKPFKYAYEKEIVLYAHYLGLKYFSTECTYAPRSTRSLARTYIKNLEKLDSVYILNIIRYAELINGDIGNEEGGKVFGQCVQCGGSTANEKCKACLFVSVLSNE